MVGEGCPCLSGMRDGRKGLEGQGHLPAWLERGGGVTFMPGWGGLVAGSGGWLMVPRGVGSCGS